MTLRIDTPIISEQQKFGKFKQQVIQSLTGGSIVSLPSAWDAMSNINDLMVENFSQVDEIGLKLLADPDVLTAVKRVLDDKTATKYSIPRTNGGTTPGIPLFSTKIGTFVVFLSDDRTVLSKSVSSETFRKMISSWIKEQNLSQSKLIDESLQQLVSLGIDGVLIKKIAAELEGLNPENIQILVDFIVSDETNIQLLKTLIIEYIITKLPEDAPWNIIRGYMKVAGMKNEKN